MSCSCQKNYKHVTGNTFRRKLKCNRSCSLFQDKNHDKNHNHFEEVGSRFYQVDKTVAVEYDSVYKKQLEDMNHKFNCLVHHVNSMQQVESVTKNSVEDSVKDKVENSVDNKAETSQSVTVKFSDFDESIYFNSLKSGSTTVLISPSQNNLGRFNSLEGTITLDRWDSLNNVHGSVEVFNYDNKHKYSGVVSVLDDGGIDNVGKDGKLTLNYIMSNRPLIPIGRDINCSIVLHLYSL